MNFDINMMYKSLIITALVLLTVPVFAQNWHDADSLRKALGRNNPDMANAGLFLKLAEFEIFKPGEFKSDLDSAAAYIAQAKKINQRINSIAIYGHIILTESYLQKELGQTVQGKILAEKAIQTLKNGPYKDLLGSAYLALSDYYNYQNSIELPKKIAMVTAAASAFNTAGSTEREAYAYKVLGDIETADALSLKHLMRSLALYNSINYIQLQGVYDEIGADYLDMSSYPQALSYEFKALEIARRLRDTSMQLCEINNHIGIIYYKTHEFDQSIKFFDAALNTAMAYKDIQTIYLLTSNICQSELLLKRPREGLHTLEYTLHRFPTQKNDVNTDLAFTTSFVKAYIMLRQFNNAKPYCEHLLDVISHYPIPDKTLSDMYSVLIQYFFGSKQYARELIYLNKNNALTNRLGIPINISVNTIRWFELDTAQHDYKAAVGHLLTYYKVYNSIYNATKDKQINQLQVQYETKEKEDKIKLLNQKSALEQRNLNQAILVKKIIIGVVLVLLVITCLLYRQYLGKQKSNIIISQKNLLLEQLVKEKELLVKEVHHRVKNNLHTILSLLESQAAHLKDEGLAAVEVSQHRIYAMSLIHQKLYQSEDIRTIMMDRYITEFVEHLGDSFEGTKHVHFILEIEPILLTVSKAVPLALIINEAITNSMKYAFPDKRPGIVTISMHQHGEQVSLLLADNGIGIGDFHKHPKANTLGIELMKGLCKEIHGQIAFTDDFGTKISLIFNQDFPLHLPGKMGILENSEVSQ